MPPRQASEPITRATAYARRKRAEAIAAGETIGPIGRRPWTCPECRGTQRTRRADGTRQCIACFPPQHRGRPRNQSPQPQKPNTKHQPPHAMNHTILDPKWAQMTIDTANTSIRNGWHPASALRATHTPAMTRCTSDTTAILLAWCPQTRGYIQQAVELVNNQWQLA